jgi:hypothetical protein
LLVILQMEGGLHSRNVRTNVFENWKIIDHDTDICVCAGRTDGDTLAVLCNAFSKKILKFSFFLLFEAKNYNM